MKNNVTIGIIGDFDSKQPAHKATNEALEHCAVHLGLDLRIHWLGTEPLAGASSEETAAMLGACDGLFCAPGSPYKSLCGALAGIRFARENNKTFLGTCGGFQHAILEFAVNRLGCATAGHAEYSTNSNALFITPLSCALLAQTRDITLRSPSKVDDIYKQSVITERYNCSFGLNHEYRAQLQEAGFLVSGEEGEGGEARIMEIPALNFYVATLFQPQLSSTPDNPHPLLLAYLRSAAA